MTDPTTAAHDRLTHIEQLLLIFWDGDEADQLRWSPANGGVFVRTNAPPCGPVSFSADCSDTFVWASADAEPITLPDDLESLRQAVDDAEATVQRAREEDPGTFVYVDWVALWCSRKRGMRPMQAWLDRNAKHPVERALFEACGPGPERGLGNP